MPRRPADRPDRHLTARVVAGLCLIVLLAGCVVGAANRTFTIAKEKDIDGDTAYDWLAIRLKGGAEAPVPVDELDVRTTTPTGHTVHEACWSPTLQRGACEDPLQPDEAWLAGQAIYVPCQGQGLHAVEIIFPNGGTIPGEISCGEAAGS